MNSTQAHTATLCTALVACFAAVAVAQAMYRQPVQVAGMSAPTTAQWAAGGDASVPDATTAFASAPETTVEVQVATF